MNVISYDMIYDVLCEFDMIYYVNVISYDIMWYDMNVISYDKM